MGISEAVVVYDGHGVTTQVSRLSATAMTVYALVTPRPGDAVTVFIDGIGKLDSCVTYVSPPRIDLSFLTDTQERWRQLQALRQELA
tara:strand:- start:3317 stop:3577 length:261 start_codon:yes stop_codon:yes gene_type:complete